MPRGGTRAGAGRKPNKDKARMAADAAAEEAISEPKRPRGRPRIQRSESLATQISAMAGYGLPHRDIAKFVGIDYDTFFRLYNPDINRGAFQSNARLSQTAYQRAMGTPAEYDEQGRLVRAERQGSDNMLIFLCKVRLRWRTTDPDEPPPEPNLGGAPVGPASPESPRMIIDGQSIEETARVYRELMASRG